MQSRGRVLRASAGDVRRAALMAVNARPRRRRTPSGAELLSNVPLTTQDGRKVRFYDDLIKGKIVAVNFIYTSASSLPSKPRGSRRCSAARRPDGRDSSSTRSRSTRITTPPASRSTPRSSTPVRVLFLTQQDDIDLSTEARTVFTANPRTRTAHPHLLVGNEVTGQWIRNSV